MPRIDAISKPASSRIGGGCASVFIVAFLGMFVLIGTGVGFFVSIRPLYLAFRARSWTAKTCEVISSRVVHGDETSRPAIVYRYVVGDQVYTAERYDFLPGSNSDSKVPDVVASHPPGAVFECYVDPDDPTRAVINRTPTLWYYLGLVFFAGFAGIPGGIIWLLVRPQGRSPSSLGSTAVSQAAFAGDPRFAPAFTSGDSGPLVLAPSVTPIGKLVTSMVVCLFWNGLVGVFTYFEIRAFIDGGSDVWFMAIFLLLFQVIGLAILVNVPFQALALTNPRPILTLSRSAVPLGASVPFTWELSGAAHRVTGLTITLRGREEAKYRQGTDTKTDTNDFTTETLVQATQAMGIARGSGTIRVPAGSMHTFTAPHNKIIWTLHVAGTIRRWPDVDETFEITVRPA